MKIDARMLLGLFLPLFTIYCVKQGYFLYGNVLQAYGFSTQAIGLLLGSLYIAAMLMRPVGNMILERFGVRRVLLLGGGISLAGCTTLYFAQSVPSILAGRLLVGAGVSIYSTGIFAYQALVVPEKMRGAVFSIVVTGGILPMAIVMPFGEWLLSGGRTGAYLAMGPLLCLVCLYLANGMVRNDENIDVSVKKWGTYRELLASRRFVLTVISGVLISLADATVVSISLLAMAEGVTVSYFMASSAITAVMVRAPGARLLNALPRKSLLIPFGMLLPATLLVMSLFPSNLSFLLCGAIFGIGIGAAWPMLLALVSDILPAQLRPKGTAVTILLYDSCWFLTPFLIGFLSQYGSFTQTFFMVAAISLTALSLTYVLFWIPAFRNN